MSTKKEEATNGCFSAAADNEPVFVLRAQDLLAPQLVRLWAHMATIVGCQDSKVLRALDTAKAMEAWPNRKYPD